MEEKSSKTGGSSLSVHQIKEPALPVDSQRRPSNVSVLLQMVSAHQHVTYEEMQTAEELALIEKIVIFAPKDVVNQIEALKHNNDESELEEDEEEKKEVRDMPKIFTVDKVDDTDSCRSNEMENCDKDDIKYNEQYVSCLASL